MPVFRVVRQKPPLAAGVAKQPEEPIVTDGDTSFGSRASEGRNLLLLVNLSAATAAELATWPSTAAMRRPFTPPAAFASPLPRAAAEPVNGPTAAIESGFRRLFPPDEQPAMTSRTEGKQQAKGILTQVPPTNDWILQRK